MTVAAADVVLYAATHSDYQTALGAAAAAGIPATNVIGNYAAAWNHVEQGDKLVLAVGAAAVNALYVNPCRWATPNHETGGATPFVPLEAPAEQIPGQNRFINCAGRNAGETETLATMSAYYAVQGSYPDGAAPLPKAAVPSRQCLPEAQMDVTPGRTNLQTPVPAASTESSSASSVPRWGIDTSASVDAAFLSCVEQNYGTPAFCGRWLMKAPGISEALSADEVLLLHSRNIQIIPLYRPTGGLVGYAEGTLHASECIAAARALGMPHGIGIFAVLEANDAVDEGWIRGFCDAATRGAYVPGFVGSPINGGFASAYCAAVSADETVAKNAVLWSTEYQTGISTKADAPAWNPASPHCSGRPVAWRYGTNGSACKHSLNTDLADPTLFKYAW